MHHHVCFLCHRPPAKPFQNTTLELEVWCEEEVMPREQQVREGRGGRERIAGQEKWTQDSGSHHERRVLGVGLWS